MGSSQITRYIYRQNSQMYTSKMSPTKINKNIIKNVTKKVTKNVTDSKNVSSKEGGRVMTNSKRTSKSNTKIISRWSVDTPQNHEDSKKHE